MERSRRAGPMAAEDRRAAIVEAVIPLLRTRGWAVTTREVAAAAGVAEGTIFSVFPDKDALLVAAMEAALDPDPTAERLAQIDSSLPLVDRLTLAVEILQDLMTEVWQLVAVLHLEQVRRRLRRHVTGDFFAQGVLPQIFEPSRNELRLAPEVAAQALVALTMAGSNPMLFGAPIAASDIVTLMLDGIRVRPGEEPEGAVAGTSKST